MIVSESASARFAEILANLGAVHVAADQPFFYTSGWASPVYIDARVLMSDVAARNETMNLAAQAMREVAAKQDFNVVVGVENSGIAFAAWLAERLGLPMSYLRKRPIGWGSRAQVEGRLPETPRALLVDDITTDGVSKIAAATALRQTGARVEDILVLMEFALYPETAQRIAAQGLALHALTDWRALHAALEAGGGLSAAQADMLRAFDADPVRWSIEHGGVGA